MQVGQGTMLGITLAMYRYWGSAVHSKFSRKAGKVSGFAASALVLSAIGAGFLLYELSQSQTEDVRKVAAGDPEAGGHTTGSILLRGGADGGCRHLRFDNVTGSLKQGVDTACDNKAPATNSTEGRMNAIRDAFSKK
jgi:hypothetical protein